MFNIDLAISVGIWTAGVGMSLVGIEMTIHPPNDSSPHLKWWYRGSFILLGVLFVGLSIWQFERAAAESLRSAHEHQEEQIRNEGNIKFVQGQLDAMTKVLGGLSTNSNPQTTISALKGILPSIVSMQSGKSALEKMGSKALQTRVIDFANQMRTFVATYHDTEMRIFDSGREQMMATQDEAKRNELWKQQTQRSDALSRQFDLDYKRNFSGAAVAYRDELLRRLGPQPPEDPLNRPLALDEVWVAPTSVEATAIYLEKLARKLPT
jgi:hypothetical protein